MSLDITQAPADLSLIVILVIIAELSHLVSRQCLRNTPRPAVLIDRSYPPITFHGPEFN